jgi:hypothetical protein
VLSFKTVLELCAVTLTGSTWLTQVGKFVLPF